MAEHNHVIAAAFFTVSWMIIDPLGTGWSWSKQKKTHIDDEWFQHCMNMEPMHEMMPMTYLNQNGHGRPVQILATRACIQMANITNACMWMIHIGMQISSHHGLAKLQVLAHGWSRMTCWSLATMGFKSKICLQKNASHIGLEQHQVLANEWSWQTCRHLATMGLHRQSPNELETR